MVTTASVYDIVPSVHVVIDITIKHFSTLGSLDTYAVIQACANGSSTYTLTQVHEKT